MKNARRDKFVSVIRPMTFPISVRVIIKKRAFLHFISNFRSEQLWRQSTRPFKIRKWTFFCNSLPLLWKSNVHSTENPFDSPGTITVVWSHFTGMTKHLKLLWKHLFLCIQVCVWNNKINREALYPGSVWGSGVCRFFSFVYIYFDYLHKKKRKKELHTVSLSHCWFPTTIHQTLQFDGHLIKEED